MSNSKKNVNLENVKLSESQAWTIGLAMKQYAEKHVNDANFTRNYNNYQNRLVKMFKMENLEKMEKEAAEKAAVEANDSNEPEMGLEVPYGDVIFNDFEDELNKFVDEELDALTDDANIKGLMEKTEYFKNFALNVCTSTDNEKIIEAVYCDIEGVFGMDICNDIKEAVKEYNTVYTVRYFADDAEDEEDNFGCIFCEDIRGFDKAVERANEVYKYYSEVYYVPGWVEVIDDEDNEYYHEEV